MSKALLFVWFSCLMFMTIFHQNWRVIMNGTLMMIFIIATSRILTFFYTKWSHHLKVEYIKIIKYEKKH